MSRTTYGQTYANSQTNGVTGICLLCGVSNPNNPVNNTNLNDYSQFNITAGLLGVTIHQTLIFPAATSGGCDSLIVGVGATNNPLSVNLFGGVSVQTFNGSVANSDSAGVTTANFRTTTTGRGEIFLKPSASFDRVKITLSSSLLGLLNSLQLYYAFTSSTIPAAPVITPAADTIAVGDTAVLSASSGSAAISWYTASTGGTLLATGSTLSVSPAATTTYYAAASSGTCTSTRTAVTVVVQDNNCCVAPANPFGYYPFSGNANDSTPNANNGATYKVAFRPDSICGQAALFDGIGSVVTLPYDSLPVNQLSLSVWIKPDSNNVGTVISGRYSPGTSGWELVTNNNRVFMVINTTHQSEAGVGGPVPPGRWSHIAVTYNGSLVKVFLNGQLLSSYAPSLGTIKYTSDGTFYGIGNDGGSGSGGYDGRMDELYIYNQALSDSAVRAFYNSYAYSLVTGPASNEFLTIGSNSLEYVNPTKMAGSVQPVAQSLKLFPNPSNGVIYFKEGTKFQGATAIVKTGDGSIVYRGTIKGNSLDLTGLTASGMYFIQLITPDKKVFVDKIMITK